MAQLSSASRRELSAFGHAIDHFHPDYIAQTRSRPRPAPVQPPVARESAPDAGTLPALQPAPAPAPEKMTEDTAGEALPPPKRRRAVEALKTMGAISQAVGSATIAAGRFGHRSLRASGRAATGILVALRKPRVKPADALATLTETGRYTALGNRLLSVAPLSSEETAAIRYGAVRRQVHQSGSVIAMEGELAPRPMFIASGWACLIRVHKTGRRQIVSFLLPGDPIGLKGSAQPFATTTICALTSLETVDGRALTGLASDKETYPGLAHALRRICAQQDVFLVNQITRLGCPDPDARLAHLLLELRWRLAMAGLATETQFSLPLSFETLGDALSLSPKTVARAAASLRRQNALRWRYQRIDLLQPGRLEHISGFESPLGCPEGELALPSSGAARHVHIAEF